MKFMTMLTLPAFLLVLCALPLRSIGKPKSGRRHELAWVSLGKYVYAIETGVCRPFNISCKPQVKAEFNHGIALLHFVLARRGRKVIRKCCGR